MTMKELNEAVMSGVPCCVVEYRKSKVEEVKYRDKETGQPHQFTKLSHAVETSNSAFTIDERTSDDFSAATYRPSMRPGQKVVWLVQSRTMNKGRAINTGQLVPLEQ